MASENTTLENLEVRFTYAVDGLRPAVQQSKKGLKDVKKGLDNLQKGHQNLTSTSSKATTALFNFNRIIEDAPFGIQAVSNNIVPFIDSLQRLQAEAKKSGTSVTKQLLKTLKGPGGVITAFSIATAAAVLFGDEIKKMTGKVLGGARELKEFKEIAKDLLNVEELPDLQDATIAELKMIEKNAKEQVTEIEGVIAGLKADIRELTGLDTTVDPLQPGVQSKIQQRSGSFGEDEKEELASLQEQLKGAVKEENAFKSAQQAAANAIENKNKRTKVQNALLASGADLKEEDEKATKEQNEKLSDQEKILKRLNGQLNKFAGLGAIGDVTEAQEIEGSISAIDKAIEDLLESGVDAQSPQIQQLKSLRDALRGMLQLLGQVAVAQERVLNPDVSAEPPEVELPEADNDFMEMEQLEIRLSEVQMRAISLAGTLSGAFTSAIDGAESFGDIIQKIYKQMGLMIARALFFAALTSIFSGGSLTFGSAFLNGLAGGAIQTSARSSGIPSGAVNVGGSLGFSPNISGTGRGNLNVSVSPSVLPNGDLLFAENEGRRRLQRRVYGE